MQCNVCTYVVYARMYVCMCVCLYLMYVMYVTYVMYVMYVCNVCNACNVKLS